MKAALRIFTVYTEIAVCCWHMVLIIAKERLCKIDMGVLRIQYFCQTTIPLYNCMRGKIMSHFFPQTTLQFSMVNFLKFLGSMYLLYWGCGFARINGSKSTRLDVPSLKNRWRTNPPTYSARSMQILVVPIFLLLYFLGYLCTTYLLFKYKEVHPLLYYILVVCPYEIFGWLGILVA